MRALHGVLARFRTPEEVLRAAERAREAGYRRLDAFTPMPVEGLPEALGAGRSRIPLLAFAGGLAGAASAYLLQWWISAVDYPLDVGGRPYASWPAFTVTAFELTILFAALTAVVALFVRCGLPRPHHPLFDAPGFERATTDRFFLLVLADDPAFDPDATRRFLATLSPEEVTDVPS